MLAVWLLILIAVQSTIRFFASMTIACITETSLAELRTKSFDHIIRLPMHFFAERRVGELSSRLSSDLSQIQETFAFTVLELLRQTIFMIGGIGFILTAGLDLALPVLLALPILVLIAVMFGRFIRKQSTKTQDALAMSATIIEETLQAISSVKSFTNEQFETKRYQGALQNMIGLALRTAKLRSAFVSFILFTFFGGIAGVIWYGGSLVQQGTITVGDFATFLIYAMFVGGAMGSFAELLGQIQKALGASVRLREILDADIEMIDSSDQNKKFRPLHSISLKDVNFHYPSRPDIPALKSINLEIKSGQRIAFVGESGAGKSTTASLIQQFYQPSEGVISYDGIPASELGLSCIRASIGIVPQDIVLFGGTIAENIRYGNIHAEFDEIMKAAELANAKEFIERFPEGYDTIVGERGITLSGGQRQRIAIARAILKNPPILILDEATSSLDSSSEHLISEALERLMESRTTIIIAHRLSTIKNCDAIAVFDKGSIIEYGTHDALIVQNGVYAHLSALQLR
jgi:ABC-type multidrug transport system fused ATPase/permease subunit